MADPFIVFFDTFNHDGQIKENTDCVRFNTGIQLSELRILPFGSVVDSNISDEPIISATNPASFDIKLYSNSRTNTIVLQDIAKHHFDEKNGISSIIFEEPIHSNFLLFRGRYLTLTVAIFGIPLLPLDPAIPPCPDFSVPPPLTLPVAAPNNDLSCAPSTFHSVTNPPFQAASMLPSAENKPAWTAEVQKIGEPLCPSDSTVRRTNSPSFQTGVTEDVPDVTNEAPPEVTGFYEDGEIQDIDYEEISSNEELFSDPDEADSAENGRQPVDQLTENDPRLERCLWRFNPWSMATVGETGSASDRLRIPDPTATLFQLHCWLLERGEQQEQQPTQKVEEPGNNHCDEALGKAEPTDAENRSSLMPPPPDDWTLSETSAQYLCSVTEKFAVSLDKPLAEDWVEAVEGLEAHLAPGLAFLYHTDKTSFHTVTQSIVAWVYVGLDMASALRQPNSAYIVRHLQAGIKLAGLVTGTLCPQIAWPLLYPDMAAVSSQLGQPEVFQVQHLLLNLIESPLITSTLKLAICQALDQTTRLAIGLDAFLGRCRPLSLSEDHASGERMNDNAPSDTTTQPRAEDELHMQGTEECGVPSAHDNAQTKPEPTDQPLSPMAEVASKQSDAGAIVDEASDHLLTRSPYQRLVFLFAEFKNARITAAYQRLLNKLHAYELFVEFHDFVEQIRTQDEPADDVFATLNAEHRLTYFLSRIDELLRNAATLVANPRQTPPCAMLLEESKLSYRNPYPDLCSMLDAAKLLDDLVWLVTRFKSTQPAPITRSDESSEASYDCAGTPDSGYDQDPHKPAFVTHRSDAVWLAQRCVLSSLLSDWNLLTFLASRPESTGKLLSSLLQSAVSSQAAYSCCMALAMERTAVPDMALERLVLGLELAYKMEALRHLDVLIDWARKKGIRSMATELCTQAEDRSQLMEEPLLHGALFGLARLCVSFANAPRPEEVDSETFEAAKLILSASGPSWVGQVVSMDDNFAPFLMLLEAFTASENAVASANVKGSDASKKVPTPTTATTTPTTTTPADTTADSVPNSGSRSTLRQLLTTPLTASNLVNIIVLTVLHHSEDVNYLTRYGPHLAQLVQAYIWEESMNEPAVVSLCTRLQSFSRAGAPYLSWLRDFPNRPAAQTLLSLCETNSLFSESFAWLVNQLRPLGTELEEAMDELLSLETADELLNAALAPMSCPPAVAGRRQTSNQGVVAGRSLPPALLLLLRLLRAHVCDCSGDRATWTPERQVLLARSLALIELYSVDGLHRLSTLIEKMADFFLLNCQATMSQASSMLDLIGVSAANSNVSLLLGMLDCAAHIVSQLLTTILHVQQNDFQDLTPVRPLCQAYACAMYAVCAPGPKQAVSKRLRKSVISGLLAFTRVDEGLALSVKEIENSLWVSVLREIIAFTISASMYYVPGLRILLDLLPLPLPITSLRPLDESSQRQIRTARDRWTVHLLALIPELTGLTELIGGTDPVPSNPLHALLTQLVHRLADLGVPCAVFLATSCLDTMFAVSDELFRQKRDKPAGKEAISTAVDSDPASKTSSTDKCMVDAPTTAAYLPLRTPSVQLLLHASSDTNFDSSSQPENPCTTSQFDSSKACGFADLEDPTELTSTLAFFYLNLQIPACRYAILHLLRQGPTTRDPKATDELPAKSDRSTSSRTRHAQLLSLIRHVLLSYSDQPGHIRTQLMLLKCLDLLLHTELAFRGFLPDEATRTADDVASLLTRLAEGQADLKFSEELVPILLEHISHPDRDMTTLPSALYPLLFLSQHDQGFMIVRNALDSPSARMYGQHFFANMVQRVNDCFSAENPDCQITLAVCLRLLQSLLVGRSTLPITFTPDPPPTQPDTESPAAFVGGLRRLHISSARVRDWIGWSAGSDEGKPVRDLHALLEMLTDDEPSLEYLRSGMKNLLSLLSEEFDVPECDLSDSELTHMLPKPRPLEELFASRPQFVSLIDGDSPDADAAYRRVLVARRKFAKPESVDLCDEVAYSADVSPALVAYNFAELALNYCGGVNIKEELTKCGRQRTSGDAAIRHQKRRRGQSSIIETGRSSKKFVAPMRGRGFVIRSGVGQSNSSGGGDAGGSGGSLLSGPGPGSGIRSDPFRSRPLNTSRPPSLHVDDFTKLVKTDAVVEETPRSRSYRDGRGFRGRGQRVQLSRETPSGLSLAGALVPNLAFGLPVVNPLGAAASLLPSWPAPRALPLLFNVEPRTNSSRRDRSSR